LVEQSVLASWPQHPAVASKSKASTT
jgi:hypothetical protein